MICIASAYPKTKIQNNTNKIKKRTDDAICSKYSMHVRCIGAPRLILGIQKGKGKKATEIKWE